MRLCHRSFLAALALLALSACGTKDVLSGNDAGYIADVERQVASIDWDKAQTVDVKLTEWRYQPSTLRFERGKPYRLHFVNDGIEAHDFSSKEFFQSIAVARLVGPGTNLMTPRLVSVGVDAGESKDLFFVPVRAGSYAIECDEPLHAAFGMRGTVEID
ncbi:MAG: hypothetical protein ACM30I_18155 [Gemmatimonas sp.]